MHLSTRTRMRVEPLRRRLERAATFGYGSIELTGEPGAHPVVGTAKLLADTGMRFWGAGSVMRGERNRASADAGRRARTVEYLGSLAGMAAGLGGSVVTVVPASAWWRPSRRCAAPATWVGSPRSSCRRHGSGHGPESA